MRQHKKIYWLLDSLRNSLFQGLILLILIVLSKVSFATTAHLEKARDYLQDKNFSAAHEMLNQISARDQDPKRMALIETFRGLIYYEQKKYKVAVEHFQKGLSLGTRLSDVSYYYLGLSQMEIKQNDEALKSLNNVKQEESTDFLEWKAEYQVGRIYMQQGKINPARRILQRIRSKMRNTDTYPEILFALMNLDLQQNKGNQACYWARELYKKYPTYPPVAEWGLRWEENRVEDKALSCQNSLSDQQDRIKRLQWMGASEKAFAELKVFEKSKIDKFTKDMAMAEYLVNEGRVSEAFERLLPYYKDKKNKEDYDFISLLAKAASRAGEFHAAIGIYMAAFDHFRGGKQRTSLYRAAFLSYQHKDYDGAVRKFETLTKKYPYTSLAKQSNWYISWIYYLKGNHKKSHLLLSEALKNKSRIMPNGVSRSKIKYWMAMNKKRMGENEEAQKLFLEISHDENMGYYSIASIQRLRELIGDRGLASIKYDQASSLRDNWLPHIKQEEDSQDIIDRQQTPITKTNATYFTEWDGLPYMQEYLDLNQPTQIFTKVSTPEFRKRIERAKDMGLLGLNELAKWELYTVEGRTRDQEYLKTLMFEYHRNQVYHRAAYIGTRHFAGARTHLGLHLGASLWHFVFPRAFEKEVLSSSQKFNVPAEFVWSIMKAETNFRPDALSPVGAKGLMQVMTHTGRKVASLMGKTIEGEDLFLPAVGIEIGTRYLQRNLKKFKNKIPLAAAAYNGGPHRVHSWLHQFGDLQMDEFIEHIPFLETRNYVKKVTRYYTLYNLLYNKNADATRWLAENVDVYPEGTPPTRETWEML